MPAIYAHDRFGSDVLSCLSETVRSFLKKESDLFYIGLQGPDIFFYDHPLKSDLSTRIGSSIHAASGMDFFRRAVPANDAQRAYLAGVLCHFTLDASCHSYIGHYTAARGISHEEIESEFDRSLLVRDGKNPLSQVLTSHLHPSGRSSAAIVPLYRTVDPNLTAGDIHRAVRDMVLFQSILRCPHSFKRKALNSLFKRMGKDHLGCHIIPKEANPQCAEACRSLLTLYEQAVPDAAEIIYQFLSSGKRADADPNDTDFFKNPLLAYNFNGQKVL